MSISPSQNNNESRTLRKENEKNFPFNFPKRLNSKLYYSQMQKIRITQKNLVYLIGFPKFLADNEKLLSSFEYLGQYGKILKININKNKIYNSNNPNGPSYSCHITYSSFSESSLAILNLDNFIFENHIIKASFGTTKFCSNFLYGNKCNNKDCLYLHYFPDVKDIINKDDINYNKTIYKNQHIKAIKLSGIFNNINMINYLKDIKNKRTIFPNASNVYSKDIVKEYYENYKNKINLNFNDNDNMKKKKIYSIIGLDNLYKREKKSRFDFATNAQLNNNNENNNQNNIDDIPLEISNFISENIKKSILFKRENDEISDYFFSINKSYEKEDKWKSLLNTLENYSIFENCRIRKIGEDENIIVVNKYNTY